MQQQRRITVVGHQNINESIIIEVGKCDPACGVRTLGGDSQKSQQSWISSPAFLPLIPAIFAEVAVGLDLGMVRTRRIVAVYDVGKVINQKLARSQ